MKLIEAIQNVDQSVDNIADYGLPEGLLQEFGYNEYDFPYDQSPAFQDSPLKAYWLVRWYCTDTSVGVKVFFLNDVPVAVSSQVGRKMTEDFSFVSKEARDVVYDWLVSIRKTEEWNNTMVDPDQEIREFYSVEFTNQLLDFEGFVNGKPVTIDRATMRNHDPKNYILQTVPVTYEDGTVAIIPITDFKIPVKVKT